MGIDEKCLTKNGYIKAGAPVPKTIGPGGIPDIKPTNIAPEQKNVEQVLEHFLDLRRWMGISNEIAGEYKEIIRSVGQEVANMNKEGKRVTLSFLIRMLRGMDGGSIDIERGSVLDNLLDVLKKEVGGQGEINVYPVFLFQENEIYIFSREIDIVLDIKFDQNRNTQPIFQTIHLGSTDTQNPIVSHRRMVNKNVNFTISYFDRKNENYDQRIATIAQEIANSARQEHSRINWNTGTGLPAGEGGGVRIVRFDK